MTSVPDRSGHPARRPTPRGARLAPAVPHPSSESARLRRLIAAQGVINSNLSLPDVLTRIVRTACEISEARFGALGVFGPDERLEHFVQIGPDGVTEGVHTVADPQVAGRTEHDDTTSFLVVPIQVRDEVVGEIYLAGAAAGRFTAADEELVAALATTAGSAIVNARLYDEAQRANTWSRASHDITRALLAEADVDMLLEVVSQALEAAEADFGMLALPDRDGVLRATVAVGLGAERFTEWTFRPEDSPISAVMATGQTTRRDSIDGLTRASFTNPDGYGPIMVAPLADANGLRGTVLLIRTAGRPAFTAAELGHLRVFADQVALALDMDETRDAAGALRELEVRHNIAKDLHDNVIQHLFAIGMGLHSINPAKLPPAVSERLARYVAEFDQTIDEIRERVFGLRSNDGADPSVHTRFRYVRPAAADDAESAIDGHLAPALAPLNRHHRPG